MPLSDYGDSMTFDSSSSSFLPNPKLQARNVNKAHKQMPEECTYYDEMTLKSLASKLVSALDYLHNEQGIVHRDIKPQNILIDECGSPLLSDFGKSRQLTCPEDDMTTSIEGTSVFHPPECCSFEDYEQ